MKHMGKRCALRGAAVLDNQSPVRQPDAKAPNWGHPTLANQRSAEEYRAFIELGLPLVNVSFFREHGSAF